MKSEIDSVKCPKQERPVEVVGRSKVRNVEIIAVNRGELLSGGMWRWKCFEVRWIAVEPVA